MTDYAPELRLGCYEVNQVTSRRLWLAFGIIPTGVSKSSYERDMVYLEFDENDLIRRFTNVTTVTRRTDGAAQWAVSGQWRCAAATVNGERLSEETLKQLSVRIKGDQWRALQRNPFLFDGHIYIHAKQRPPGFSLMEKKGPEKRRQAYGVISLRGDTMEICYAPERYERRPLRFESSPGSGNYWFVWTRELP